MARGRSRKAAANRLPAERWWKDLVRAEIDRHGYGLIGLARELEPKRGQERHRQIAASLTQLLRADTADRTPQKTSVWVGPISDLYGIPWDVPPGAAKTEDPEEVEVLEIMRSLPTDQRHALVELVRANARLLKH